jgi:hypothetical protein
VNDTVIKVDVRVITRHDVYIDVDVPVSKVLRPMYKGGLFRPTRLHLQWVASDGDGWRLIQADLSGPMLKKDGSDGQNTGNRRLVGVLADGAIPDWAMVLIDEHTPTVVGNW